MIDLNKYYISSVYQGASGGSEGRSGFVPKALSGDELKFLRGDGTWQNAVSQTMVGATSSTAGQAGLVPQPLSGDNTKYLKGDGTWSDPTISNIQYIEAGNSVLLNVNVYDTFMINLTGSSTFTYVGFDSGKTINVYLAADHEGHLPHTFPLNTTFSELGDNNTIYSFNGYVTRLLLQNVGNQVINFSSIAPKTSAIPYYNGNTTDPPGVGLDIIEQYLNNLLAEFNL